MRLDGMVRGSYTPPPQFVVLALPRRLRLSQLLIKPHKKGALSESIDAGWSSLVARRAHNPKVVGSNPAPATNSMAACCSLVIASEAPFGAFLWPKEKWPGGHRHVGQGSAIDAAFTTDS